VRWRQTAKTPGLAERSSGEFTRSGFQPAGHGAPVSRLGLMGRSVCGKCIYISLSHSEAALCTGAAKRLVRMHLIYPVSTEEPAVAGIGGRITATYVVSWSPLLRTWEARLTIRTRAEVRGGKHPQKTLNASDGSQRGHRTRSVGKPRTWGRACAVRRNDGMGENPCWPYQEVSKPLGLSVVGRSAA
jgi:hypothetical protein